MTSGVDELAARLRAVGCVFAEEEAAEILRLGADPDAIVAARAAGIPLEQALGVAVFDGLDVRVGDGVFVPRRRAEILVEAGVRERPEATAVVDLGCGSGALAAALAVRMPHAAVHACDIDPAALRYARLNAERYGFSVHEGDWWEALPDELRGRIGLAVAYLPHVPDSRLDDIPADFRDHEPEGSVAGGVDGLDPLRRVLEGVEAWLAPDGALVTLVADEQRDAATALVGSRRVVLVTG